MALKPELPRKIKQALINYLQAHDELARLWDEMQGDGTELQENYPFSSCFNDIFEDVKKWVTTHTNS